MKILAKFSPLRSFVLFFGIAAASLWIWTRPYYSDQPFIIFISSDRWAWMWPFAALGGGWLTFGMSLTVLRILFFKSSAIYLDSDSLVFIFPFIMKCRFSEIVEAKFLSTTGILKNSGIIRLYMKNGKYNSIRTALLLESPQVTVDNINALVRA